MSNLDALVAAISNGLPDLSEDDLRSNLASNVPPPAPNGADLVAPTGNQTRGRFWVFTLNNYTPAEVAVLETVGSHLPAGWQYLLFGRETAPTTGTPHLQGYVQFKERCTMLTVRRRLCPLDPNRGVYVRLAKGTPTQCRTYCIKEGDFKEYGTMDQHKQGKRSDLSRFVDHVREQGTLSQQEMLEEYPTLMARYPHFVERVFDEYQQQPPIVPHPLKDWQQDFHEWLRLEPCDRKIYFVVDVTGGGGKSWFSDYWCSLHNACVMHPGKYADMAHVWRTYARNSPRTVFIDCPREKLDFFSYTFLENLKDGRIFSTKYDSRLIRFKVPHVVVMMNQHPDMTKLSLDRYHVIEI